MKINLGASRNWYKNGWAVLDHKIEKSTDLRICGDIAKMDLKNKTCNLVFLSHVLEHIPHIKLQDVFIEINRIMKIGSGIRILVPDLAKAAKAYVGKDKKYFRLAKLEDENLRNDLGFGGMFMNFIVSPGQDTILFDRNLRTFIAGYAHLYAYDFEMMKALLEHFGFGNVRHMNFCKSAYDDFKEPLHVIGFKPEWVNLNKGFYKKNNLIHVYKNGSYEINFRVTGFDRDPDTSLIVEAIKKKDFALNKFNDINGKYAKNYNRYAFSLLAVKEIKNKISMLTKISMKLADRDFQNKIIKLIKES